MTNQDEMKLAHTGTWTDDEKRRLMTMHKDGYPTATIAKALGRQHAVTASVLNNMQKAQSRQTERLRKGWTADEVAKLESMLKANASPQEIAVKLKRSTVAIYQRAHKLRKAAAKADAKAQQIFTAPMPQPPAVKPITLTPAQRAWARPEPTPHRNAAWAAVAVAAGFAGFILGGLAQ